MDFIIFNKDDVTAKYLSKNVIIITTDERTSVGIVYEMR